MITPYMTTHESTDRKSVEEMFDDVDDRILNMEKILDDMQDKIQRIGKILLDMDDELTQTKKD